MTARPGSPHPDWHESCGACAVDTDPVSRPEDAKALQRSADIKLYWSAQYRCHVLMSGADRVQLNRLATDILEYCDGSRSIDGLISLLATPDTPQLGGEIREFVSIALRRHWLEPVR